MAFHDNKFHQVDSTNCLCLTTCLKQKKLPALPIPTPTSTPYSYTNPNLNQYLHYPSPLRKWHSSALQSCTPEAAASFHLPQIGGEIAGLQAAMTANERVPGGTSPVVYCHNDLQYGNIMRNRRDGNLTLIVSCSLDSPGRSQLTPGK